MFEFFSRTGDFLWTFLLIGLLVGCSLFFTVRLRGIQFRMIPEMFRVMLGRDIKGKRSKGKVSSFGAFAISLASRVGTGNIAGVASAIFVGSPGAVFWMWMMALFGAATSFVESTLAQLYKRRGVDGFYGGPAYYMESGLGLRWLGVVTALLTIVNFSLAQQTVQSNTIAVSLSSFLEVDRLYVGLIVAFLLSVIVFGGIRRISSVMSYISPVMAAIYVLIAVWVIFTNVGSIPEVFRLIFTNAFGLDQAAGGMMGAAVNQGLRRGLFSNEAGEGSVPDAAAIADTSHPVKQGLVQMLGVFIDTILICSCTAFIVLLSGKYACGQDGIMLTTVCLESEIGPCGRYFLVICIFLFAFSSMVANYYYGETNVRFIINCCGNKKRFLKWVLYLLSLCTAGMIVFGAVTRLQFAWAIVDLTMALATLCNLVAICLMSGQVVRLYKDYRKQKQTGAEPEFHKESMPDIADRLEGW